MIINFIKKYFSGNDTKIIIFFTILIVLTGSIFYHNVEHWKWLDSFYFSIMTLTTVGYGDLTVKHDISKIFTIIYSIIGIGMFLSFVNSINKHTVDSFKNSDGEYLLKYKKLRNKIKNKNRI